VIQRGRVSTEHTVWCATARNVGVTEMPFKIDRSTGNWCEGHYQHAGSAREATTVARGDGWVLTKDFGWLCRHCTVAYRAWRKR
jgi:hypothetical protein